MPPQSASSVLNCSLFGLIWTPDTLGWNYFAGFSDLAFITAQSKIIHMVAAERARHGSGAMSHAVAPETMGAYALRTVPALPPQWSKLAVHRLAKTLAGEASMRVAWLVRTSNWGK